MADGLNHHGHHNPTNYGIVSSPHGPETGDDHASFRDQPVRDRDYEEAIFKSLMFPEDSYNKENEYWADMSFWKQVKFNAGVDNQETRKELRQIWEMIKRDPLSPISWYFKNAVLPGAGLGLEG